MPDGGGVKAASALESLGQRFDRASRQRAERLLARHAGRLTSAERAAYETQLRSPGSLLGLRRRLLDRLMRGAAMRRRSRHDWEGLSVPHDLPRGPYNDRAVLGAGLRRLAISDSDWTREYLDLYARMDRLRSMCRSLLP